MPRGIPFGLLRRTHFNRSSGPEERSEVLDLVALDPDVKAAFPDAQSVNEALRLLIKTARAAQELQKAS